MIEPYRLGVLPLDTPDDDPRWAQFVDLFSNAFLRGRCTEDSLEIYRKHRRADGATLGMVTATGPGLDGRQPVAGFTWAPIQLNAGTGPAPAMVINTVAVRSTHRRLGLMRELMQHHLSLGRDSGCAYAVLTASEATIYGRFGFGVATRTAHWTVDLRKLQFRPEVLVAEGSVELTDPPFVAEIFDKLSNDFVRAHRGAHAPLAIHRIHAEGAFSFSEEGPNRKLRYLVHFDTQGVPDGYVAFEHGGWDTPVPAPMEVKAVCSPAPEIDRALWRGLSGFDLVTTAEYASAPLGDPLPYSLVDSWAIEVKTVDDGIWLRLLDLPKAVAERGFEADGSVTIGVGDSLGFISGAWRIEVADGRGTALPFDGEPEVRLDASTLSRLWFGDVTAATLAAAGVIHGDATTIATLTRLFATGLAPANLTQF